MFWWLPITTEAQSKPLPKGLHMRGIHLRLSVGLQQKSPEALELVIGETHFRSRKDHDMKKGVEVGIVVKKCPGQSTRHTT